MAAQTGIGPTLRSLRIVHGILLVVSLLYVYAALARLPHTPKDLAPALFWPIAIVAFGCLLGSLFVRARWIRPSVDRLVSAPEDAAATQKWRKGVILGDVLALSVAQFGIAMWVMGADVKHVAPFFVVAVGTLLLTFPQRP
jgi:hypothetical protein